MAFELATAMVRVGADTKGLGGGFARAKGMLKSALGGIAGMVAKVGVLVGGVTLGAAIKLAANAQEANSLFKAVFREASDDAEAFATDLANNVGRSVGDVKGHMAGFQDLFVPMGMARDEASELSKTMTTLALDLASFKNKNDAAVARTLASALTGEREALKGLGVVINETDVKNELLRLGMKDLTGEALKQAKAQATLNLIMAQTADAQGDAERTSGSFTNRMKGMNGAIKDLMGDIGSGLLPALGSIAGKVTDVVRAIQPKIKAIADMVGVWTSVIIENWDLIWEIMVTSASIQILAIGDLFANIPEFAAKNFLRMEAIVSNSFARMKRTAKKWYADYFVSAQGGFDQLFENIMAAAQGRDAADLSGNKNRRESINKALGLDEGLNLKDVGEGQGLNALLEPSAASKDQMKRMNEMLDKLFEAKDKKVLEIEGADAAATEAIKKGAKKGGLSVKLDIPAGFLAASDANKKIQEAMFKQADPQKQMVGKLDEANGINKLMQQGINKIVANTDPGNKLAVEVAT